MEGESLYLYWQVSLTGATDEAAIRDVFEFVVDDCQVDIVETTGPADGGEDEAFGLFSENMPYVPPGQLTVYDGGAIPGAGGGSQLPRPPPGRPAKRGKRRLRPRRPYDPRRSRQGGPAGKPRR